MKTKVKRFSVKNAGVLDEANIELGDITLIFGRNNTGKTALANNLRLAIAHVFLPLAPEMEKLIESLSRTGLADIMSLPDDKQDMAFGELVDRIDMSSLSSIAEMIKSMSAIMQKPDPSKLDEEVERVKEYFRRLEPEEIASELQDRVKCKVGQSFGLPLDLKSHQRIGKDHEITLDFTPDGIDNFLNSGEIDEVIKISVRSAMEEGLSYRIPPIDYPLLMLFTGVHYLGDNRYARTMFRKQLDIPYQLEKSIGVLKKCVNVLKANDQNKASSENLKSLEDAISSMDVHLDSGMDLVGEIEMATLPLAYGVSRRSTTALDNGALILGLLERIVPGGYEMDGEQIVFVPSDLDKNQGEDTKINMWSASSSVRSLFEIYDYIKNRASKGDLLIIDEPEMNLDPYNQILMARLLVLLAKSGIQVVITTHSDFMVRELGNCIMLNSLDSDQIEELQDYREEYKLDGHKVKAYTMQKVEGGRCVAKEVEVDMRYGICARIFDDAIEAQNLNQDRIIRRLREKGEI